MAVYCRQLVLAANSETEFGSQRTVSSIQRAPYGRVAKELGVDPSYVNRVAHGKAESKRVRQALEAEFARLERLKPE